MTRRYIVVLVVTLVTLWAQASRAQSITIRLGHVGFPGLSFRNYHG